MYQKDIPSPPIKLAGIVVRRKPQAEYKHYNPLFPYKVEDYEVLLRKWPRPPFTGSWSILSGPMVQGQPPESTLLNEMYGWTNRLGTKMEVKKAKGLKGLKAVFLTSYGGGGRQVDPVSRKPLDPSVTLCYLIPTTCKDSSVVDLYPDNSSCPQFICLRKILYLMYNQVNSVHPYTKQVLSSLDHYLREQHAVPDGIGMLFLPSLVGRMKMSVINPLFQGWLQQEKKKQLAALANTTTLSNKYHSTPRGLTGLPRDISFDLSLMTFEEENEEEEDDEDVDLYPHDEITEEVYEGWLDKREDAVDRCVVNPFFGKSVVLDYEKLQSIGIPKSPGNDSENDKQMSTWIESFPVHKCSCDGDLEGVEKAVNEGHNPNDVDADSWNALHYAAWYGHLDVVEYLVEKADSKFNARNKSGSTPLHLAAGQGHSHIVSYLVKLKGIESSSKDKDGKTPLEVCKFCKRNDWSTTVKLLKEKDTSTINVDRYRMPSHISRGMLRNDLPETTPDLVRKSVAIDEEKGPRSCRVNLDSGQHRIVQLPSGVLTKGESLIKSVLIELGISEELDAKFALWAVSPSLQLQLGDRDSPMDVIGRWNVLVQRFAGESVKDTPHIFLRPNVFAFPQKHSRIKDLQALEILYTDARRHVVCGDYPCTEDQAIYLAGINLQIVQGDYNEAIHQPGTFTDEIKAAIPEWLTHSKNMQLVEQKVLVQYAKISESRNRSLELLLKEYIKYCSQWPFYGAMYFRVQCTSKPEKLVKWQGKPVTMGMNTRGIFIISRDPPVLIQGYQLDGLNWDASNEKQELYLTIPSTGEQAVFKTKQIHLVKTALSKFINLRTSHLSVKE